MGLHRAWKAYTVLVANVRPGHQVLDIAGGTGDLALAFARKVGAGRPGGAHRHQRGHAAHRAATACSTPASSCPPWSAMRRSCPSPTSSFDLVSVAFGLRNMTHKDRRWPR